jgi:hypothetical protein
MPRRGSDYLTAACPPSVCRRKSLTRAAISSGRVEGKNRGKPASSRISESMLMILSAGAANAAVPRLCRTQTECAVMF